MKNTAQPSQTSESDPFDETSIERLMALLSRTNLNELRLVRGSSSVHLIKSSGSVPTPRQQPPVQAQAEPQKPEETATPQSSVCAPLYGIVHLTPSPQSDPFVRVGSTVEPGQTLVLVEAMKTFHEVQAHRGGVIKAIRVEAGQEVQAGTPLMEISDHV